MNIGLDYDDTITRDPAMWMSIISIMQQSGHKVYIVTWRTEKECKEIPAIILEWVDGTYPTSRKAKEKYMYSQGIRIDVWIDDNPSAILYTMQGHEEIE